MAIKVKATFPESNQYGFYKSERRYDGATFTIDSEDHFSERWMIRLSAKKEKKK